MVRADHLGTMTWSMARGSEVSRARTEGGPDSW